MIAEIKTLFLPVCLVLFLSALLGLSVAMAQEEPEEPPKIKKKADRQELLELSEQLLDSGDSTFFERVLEIYSPYLIFVEKRVEVVGTDGVVVPVLNELPDMAVLKIVADRLKPKGSLIMGGKRVLLLEKSGKLTLGDTIPITIRKVTYEVILSGISDKTYTIKLNDTERIVSTRVKQVRGKIAFDKP